MFFVYWVSQAHQKTISAANVCAATAIKRLGVLFTDSDNSINQ